MIISAAAGDRSEFAGAIKNERNGQGVQVVLLADRFGTERYGVVHRMLLQQAGIHANPFESSAQQLLIQLANGLPRRLNQVAQRAMQQALEQNSRAVTAAHIHSALELLPWVAKL